HAQGTLVYDQQSATGPVDVVGNGNADGLYIQEDQPLVQSFIPALSVIGFVQLEFEDVPDNGTNGATVYVDLWTGSPIPNTPLATLLGSTTSVYMPNGFNNDNLVVAGVTNFYFSTPIALTAGQTYYLQPVVQSGDNPWAIVAIGDTYPNGQLFSGNYAFNTDMWFREGIVPEPSTLALAGLSCLLVFIVKRRSKLVVLLLLAALVLPVLPAQAGQDSVVQIVADEAGITPVSAATLPSTGTFWVMTNGFDDNLIALPYPFLPPNLSALPTYSVAGNAFIIDDTGGQLVPSSSRRMSSAQAASTVQTQAQTMEDLIEQIETFDLNPTNESGTNGGYQSYGFTANFDTNGLY
ncbi:MAG: PEP-CTERM sorting domain-containing protein, partial [Candidatus Saccharimonadales bacterium]